MRRIFGPKVNEVTREWRKLHNEELNDLCYSPNIIQVVKSIRIRWARHLAEIGRAEVFTGFWWEKLRERDHLGDPDIDGKYRVSEKDYTFFEIFFGPLI
jgi:hypothetical protein